MRQHSGPAQWIVAWVLSIALALLSSGWGPALSRIMSQRPSWSVCGQALCMCQPLPDAPECPLCPAGGDTPDNSCPTEPAGRIDPSRIALVDNTPGLVLGGLGHAAEGLMIGLFLLGAGSGRVPLAEPASMSITASGWSLPDGPCRAIATPPPRPGHA